MNSLNESRLRELLEEYSYDLPEDFYEKAQEILGEVESAEDQLYEAIQNFDGDWFSDSLEAIIFDHGMEGLRVIREYVFGPHGSRVMQGKMLLGMNCEEFVLSEENAKFRDSIIKDGLTHPDPVVRGNALMAVCNLDYHERGAGRIHPEFVDWLDAAREREDREWLKGDFAKRAKEIRDDQKLAVVAEKVRRAGQRLKD